MSIPPKPLLSTPSSGTEGFNGGQSLVSAPFWDFSSFTPIPSVEILVLTDHNVCLDQVILQTFEREGGWVTTL